MKKKLEKQSLHLTVIIIIIMLRNLFLVLHYIDCNTIYYKVTNYRKLVHIIVELFYAYKEY